MSSYYSQLKNFSCNFSKIPANIIVGAAKEIGESLTNEQLKSSQLRKFYDSVKQLELKLIDKKDSDELDDKIIAQLVFLKPHLENASKKSKIPKDYKDIIEYSIDKVTKQGNTKEDFKYFVKFFESIVAYHK